MMNFLSDNRMLQATLSMDTGTENAQFPLTNLQNDFTTKVFRSNENTCSILVDIGASEAIDSVAVVGSAITGLGFTSMSIYGSPTTDFSGSTEVVVDLSAQYNFGFNLFTSTGSHRYWLIEVTNTAGDYVELSNIYLGINEQITTNGINTESFVFTEVDNVNISLNDYGQKFIDKVNKIKYLSGNVQYVNSTEFTTMNDLYVQNGKSTPVWFILDCEDTLGTDSKYIFSGYFYFQTDFQWKGAGPGLYNVSLSFMEAK